MIELLTSESEYIRLNLDDNKNFCARHEKIGVRYVGSSVQELYTGFSEDLLKLLKDRQKRVLEILRKYGIETKPKDVLNSKTENINYK